MTLQPDAGTSRHDTPAAKHRSELLTTSQLYDLDVACLPIRRALGHWPPYLVGTAADGTSATYRDVDVRLMLDDAEFAAVCPSRARWELLCMAISAYLRDRTGLPIDFQIQRIAEANEKYAGKIRNPVGMGRIFAGGGDATPDWVLPVRSGEDSCGTREGEH